MIAMLILHFHFRPGSPAKKQKQLGIPTFFAANAHQHEGTPFSAATFFHQRGVLLSFQGIRGGAYWGGVTESGGGTLLRRGGLQRVHCARMHRHLTCGCITSKCGRLPFAWVR